MDQELALYDRGGVKIGCLELTPASADERFAAAAIMHKSAGIPMPGSSLVVAGHMPFLYSIDISRLEPHASLPGAVNTRTSAGSCSRISHEGAIDCLSVIEGQAIVACNHQSASVTLFDPYLRTPKPIGMMQAHTGGVSFIAGCGDTVVTTGWRSVGGGQYQTDQFLKVFDLRMRQLVFPAQLSITKGAIPQLQPEVVGLHVLPSEPTQAFVITDFGQAQVLNVDMSSAPSEFCMVALDPMRGDSDFVASQHLARVQQAVTCSAAAPTGNAVVACDSYGVFHTMSNQGGIQNGSWEGVQMSFAGLVSSHPEEEPWEEHGTPEEMQLPQTTIDINRVGFTGCRMPVLDVAIAPPSMSSAQEQLASSQHLASQALPLNTWHPQMSFHPAAASFMPPYVMNKPLVPPVERVIAPRLLDRAKTAKTAREVLYIPNTDVCCALSDCMHRV